MKAKESGSTTSDSISEESTEYRLEFAPRALGDIDAAIAWLTDSTKSREIANHWAESLIKQIRTLTFSPERCPLAAESEAWGQEVRNLLIGDGGSQYRVVFVIRSAVVQVLTIRRSRQAAP